MANPPDIGGEIPGYNPTGDPDPNASAAQGDAQDDAKRRQAAADAAAAAQRQQYLDHFNYGGVAGGAQAASSFFNNSAGNAQNRPGEQINYDMAQGAYGQSQMSAGLSNEMAGLMRQRAMGLVPSIAQMQADRQMRQAAAEQSSAAASARGPAGLALAQQGAAANTAGLQSNISGQAQINAANERMQAEQAAFGAYSGMRGQDLQATGLQADMAQKQAALNAAQRAQNDQYSMGLYGLGNDVNKAQLGAQGNQIGIETGATSNANALKQQASQHSDDQTWKYIGLGLGAAGTAAGVAGALGLFGGSGKPLPGTTGPTFGDPGAGGYNGNAAPDGSNTVGTSGGEYGMGTYGPPDVSDVTAKQNISPLMMSKGLQIQDAGQGSDLRDAKSKQDAYLLGQAEAMKAQMGGQWANLMSQGPSVGGDPVTRQFAQGLAPSSYEYRPGIPGATPGMKVGPMAQNMAANPITGTAIRQDPRTGLLGIDGKDGLKVALGGVGHLAQQQNAQDVEIARLKEEAAAMRAQNAAQMQGLLQQGPSVGGMSDLDRRAAALGADVSAQGQGLISQGPSVGQQYLNYARGQ